MLISLRTGAPNEVEAATFDERRRYDGDGTGEARTRRPASVRLLQKRETQMRWTAGAQLVWVDSYGEAVAKAGLLIPHFSRLTAVRVLHQCCPRCAGRPYLILVGHGHVG